MNCHRNIITNTPQNMYIHNNIRKSLSHERRRKAEGPRNHIPTRRHSRRRGCGHLVSPIERTQWAIPSMLCWYIERLMSLCDAFYIIFHLGTFTPLGWLLDCSERARLQEEGFVWGCRAGNQSAVRRHKILLGVTPHRPGGWRSGQWVEV